MYSSFIETENSQCYTSSSIDEKKYPTAVCLLLITFTLSLTFEKKMSGSQRRLSLLANHLNGNRGIATNVAATTTTKQPLKETFRNRQDYKYYLPIQTRYYYYYIKSVSSIYVS